MPRYKAMDLAILRCILILEKDAQDGRKEPYLSEIARQVGAAKSTTLKYLHELEREGKVTAKPIGPTTIYHISPKGKHDVIEEAKIWASLL